tara:strand:- start:2168 stop:2365 length:198 start_codon:yes stop_codon:yes gene_type:complete
VLGFLLHPVLARQARFVAQLGTSRAASQFCDRLQILPAFGVEFVVFSSFVWLVAGGMLVVGAASA